MNTVDFIFLVGFFLALSIILTKSPFLRAVVWDTLRHPLTRSRIEIRENKVIVHHLTEAEPFSPPPPTPKSPTKTLA